MCRTETSKDKRSSVSRYSAVPHPKDLPSAVDLRNAIPKHCFEKSLVTSTAYMVRDFAIAGALMAGYMRLINDAAWTDGSIPEAGKWAISTAYWLAEGLLMWCLFVVGHDCGHGSFSNYTAINDLFGHICHAAILVPYWPWQRSHHMHHSFHNNGGSPGPVKDMSHQWFHPDGREIKNELYAMLFEPIRWALPVIGWGTYILFAEGGHFTPFGGLLWDGADLTTRVKCLVSGAAVAGVGYGVYEFFGHDLSLIMNVYGLPWFVFSWWLFTVTYLQHHHEESVVWEDEAWSYIKGAFETVDRKYGMGIDNFHHNITDGHVAHHIFFTKIPHYHLLEATEGIKAELKKRGVEDWYLYRDNSLTGGRWFVTEVWRQLMNHSFRAATWIKADGKTD